MSKRGELAELDWKVVDSIAADVLQSIKQSIN